MPRTSKAEKISAPEAKEFAPHISVATEPSENHRDRNEDAGFVHAEKEMAGVFDGMGGGLAGERASRLAAEIVSKELTGVEDSADSKEWEVAIKQALEKAQAEVLKLGNELLFKHLDNPLIEAAYKDRSQEEIEKLMEEHDMSPTGTTASVVKMVEQPDGKVDLVYGNIGDSRIYVLKKDGSFKQITKDQGALSEAVETKVFTQEEADFIDQATSREEIIKKFGDSRGGSIAKMFKNLRRSVTGALGLSKADFQTGIERLEPGDKIVITSDGVHDNLTNDEIKEIMSQGSATEVSASLLRRAGEITKARQIAEKADKEPPLRAKYDDKTAVVLEVPETVEAVEAVEEPTITAEQLTKMETDLQKLREMAEYLGKLLPMAKTMEKGLKPLTSKKRLEEIMGMGGARGVEDTIFTTQTEIMRVERTLAEHQGDIAAVQKITGRLRELRETREKQFKARDQETIDQIKSRVA
jgi:protein phosphatase